MAELIRGKVGPNDWSFNEHAYDFKRITSSI